MINLEYIRRDAPTMSQHMLVEKCMLLLGLIQHMTTVFEEIEKLAGTLDEARPNQCDHSDPWSIIGTLRGRLEAIQIKAGIAARK